MRATLFVVAVTASACTVDMDLDNTSQNAEIHNKLASNKLASNKLASNKLASNKLASNSLGELVALPDTSEILDTAEGREVYSYLATCALPEGEVIHADIAGAGDTAPPATIHTCSGGHCTFPGLLGLAPAWLDNPLDDEGKAWVSACIFARINVHDTAEAISLRGANPGLAVTASEASIYNLQEGAFFGNLFTKGDDPIDWNACRGSAQAEFETGGLALRDCAEPGYDHDNDDATPPDMTRTQCGFTYAGNCQDYAGSIFNPRRFGGWGLKDIACRTYESTQGYYSNCRSRPGQPFLHEIAITSYVSP